MQFANATNPNRKSGVAQWRDLLCLFHFSQTPVVRCERYSAGTNKILTGVGTLRTCPAGFSWPLF
jgi:hypothetical protein